MSSKGILVVGTSDWFSKSDNCGALVGVPQMDISPSQSSLWVARDASGLEGITITVEEMDPSGEAVRRTSLAKREC